MKIYQVKFNTETINYIEVDKSQPIQSIRHKMNVKTAISGIKHHPYNSEMNFGNNKVEIIRHPFLYIVAGMAKGITGTKPFRFKDEAVLFYKNISKTIPNCWIEVIFGFPSAKILPSDLF